MGSARDVSLDMLKHVLVLLDKPFRERRGDWARVQKLGGTRAAAAVQASLVDKDIREWAAVREVVVAAVAAANDTEAIGFAAAEEELVGATDV